MAPNIARSVGAVRRVGHLIARMDQLHNGSDIYEQGADQVVEVSDGRIAVENLSFAAVGKQAALINELSLNLSPGERLLVKGPSGCGKSSLLRVLAGLWPFPSGKIYRPRPGSMIMAFLPQSPLCPIGSLGTQVTYPTTYDPSLHEQRVLTCLNLVGMSHLVDRCGGTLLATRRWSTILSLGEQQRLGFARILFSRPRVVVLDESTSSLDEENEQLMYKLVSDI